MEGCLGGAVARKCEGPGAIRRVAYVFSCKREVQDHSLERRHNVECGAVRVSAIELGGYSTGEVDCLLLGMQTFYMEMGASGNGGSRASVKAGEEEAGYREKMESMGLTGAVRERTVLGQWQTEKKEIWT